MVLSGLIVGNGVGCRTCGYCNQRGSAKRDSKRPIHRDPWRSAASGNSRRAAAGGRVLQPKPIEIRIYLPTAVDFPPASGKNGGMSRPNNRAVTRAWELARSGDLRGGTEAAQAALATLGSARLRCQPRRAAAGRGILRDAAGASRRRAGRIGGRGVRCRVAARRPGTGAARRHLVRGTRVPAGTLHGRQRRNLARPRAARERAATGRTSRSRCASASRSCSRAPITKAWRRWPMPRSAPPRQAATTM